jgi:hypothetical protein
MTPDERRMLVELADELLRAGRAQQLVAELAGADDVWTDAVAGAALFELHGRRAATSRLLDLAVLRPAGDEAPVRFVLPLPGSAQPPGRVCGSQVVVDGVVLAHPGGAAFAVGTDGGTVTLADRLDQQPVAGFDPDLGLVRVTGQASRDERVDDRWDVLACRASRAIAYELLGVAGAGLDRALDHVRHRHQFGRPLGAFQSVRHRLVDARVAETAARELLDTAGDSTDPNVHLLVLKPLAGRAALTAVRAAQQVCGAIGFTEEFSLHRYVRRAHLLDSLFGGSDDAEFALGALALAGGHPIVPLIGGGPADA